MHVGTNDHHILRKVVGLGSVPDGETHLDVHLKDDSGNGRKTLLKSVGQNALGRHTESVEAEFFDVVIDPSSLVVKESHNDLATVLNTFLESIGEVVGSVTLHFHTDGLLEGNAESLGTLLEHTHEFLGVFKAVVHEDPVFEASSMLNFLLDISQIVSVLEGHFFSIHFHGQVLQGVTLHVHGLFKGNIVFVFSENTLDLFSIIIDSLETGLSIEFGVFSQFLFESGIVFLFI